MINMFDEENQDIENLFYEKELLDDINEDSDEENETEDLEDDDLFITKSVLLKESTEKTKKLITFTHKTTNKIFEGTVIGRDSNNPDKFVFIVKQINGEDKTEKTRIFNFNDLKNLKFKK